jgi:outer membrane lipase/esterase
VTNYVAISGGRVPSDNLYILWIGTNDFKAGLSADQTLDFIETEVVSLALAGARSLVAITLPDISLTPDVRAAGGATVSAAQQFVATVNVGLQNRLPWLATLFGIQITLVDINPLFTSVVNNPAAYGFANSSGAAYNPQTGVVAANPNSFVFWDGFHPTTTVHQFAAQAILTGLSGGSAIVASVTTGRP